jgi:SET domain-containing protein
MLIRSKWSTGCASATWLAALLLAREAALAAEQSVEKAAVLQINRDYDKRTVVKQSTIPNAGSGLFAAVKIKKGEIIGELGGRLVRDDHDDNGYLAELPRCALKHVRPYKMIDSVANAGHVSRINFAPSEINGRKTNFQNATIEEKCKPPFVVFTALRDIEPDEEIWASYGPNYDYDKFMKAPEVRDFFCGLKKMDCGKRFMFAH